jgi:hypothetical protein
MHDTGRVTSDTSEEARLAKVSLLIRPKGCADTDQLQAKNDDSESTNEDNVFTLLYFEIGND